MPSIEFSRPLPFAAVTALVVAGALGITSAALLAPASAAPKPVPAYSGVDFNGDGYADLAVGVPGEDLGTRKDAGAVNVLYGSPAGLKAAGNQLWSQASAGVRGAAESHDEFGDAVAGGDFDGDGHDDLAIGVPGEGLAGTSRAGVVSVLYGSPSGLTASGDDFWSQASRGVPGAAENDDRFGAALAVGNFNGDKYADLAVGSPTESVGGTPSAGSVTILYGSAAGLRGLESAALTQSTGGRDTVGHYNFFGHALAAHDADLDGYADLAVGAPGAELAQDAAGSVDVLFGSSVGLRGARGQVWSQDSPGVTDVAERNDRFGAALSFGDFNADGYAELAIGVAGEGFGYCTANQITEPCMNQGAVEILTGSKAGPTAAFSQFLYKGPGVLPGRPTGGDLLGSALAAGDFTGNGRASLAIHSEIEPTSGASVGAVYVMPGSRNGLTAQGLVTWAPDLPGAPAPTIIATSYGSDLTVGTFSGGTRAALVVAISPRPGGVSRHPGSVVVLPGSRQGLTAVGKQDWSQASAGVRGAAEGGDQFGRVGGASEAILVGCTLCGG